MKQTLSVSIAKKKKKKWDQFAPTPEGGFCSVCQKNVIDFTTLSDAEVIAFFKNKPAYTCGRFRPTQLRTYSLRTQHTSPTKRSLLHVGMLSMLALLATKQGYAQILPESTFPTTAQLPIHNEIVINDMVTGIAKGIVTDDSNQPLPGVSVSIKGTTLGTTTDANGRFELNQELKPGDVLVFAFIGFETKEYIIPKQNDSDKSDLAITLQMDVMPLMGAVAVEMPYAEQPTGIAKWWHKIKSIF